MTTIPASVPPQQPGEGEAETQPTGNAHTRNQERRARVLRHPDMAAKLTQPPLSYARPEQWNGYVPPRTWAEKLNTAPRRAALIDICKEVARRDGGEGTEAADATT